MALVTNTQDGFGGVANHSTGYITTDGGAAAVTQITCGFNPRLVRFHNLTDRISTEWIEGMAASSALVTVAAGTRTLDLVNGITVGNNGFSVTAATILASKAFAWEAIC